MQNNKIDSYTGDVINFLNEHLYYKYFNSFTESLSIEKAKNKARKLLLSNELEVSQKCASPIEMIMYYLLLYTDDIVFSPQAEIGKYKVDFCVTVFIYSLEKNKKIIIECDGHEFHEKTKEQAQHDKERDRFLQAEGYPIYRFTGSEIYRNPLKVYFELQSMINKIASGENE